MVLNKIIICYVNYTPKVILMLGSSFTSLIIFNLRSIYIYTSIFGWHVTSIKISNTVVDILLFRTVSSRQSNIFKRDLQCTCISYKLFLRLPVNWNPVEISYSNIWGHREKYYYNPKQLNHYENNLVE